MSMFIVSRNDLNDKRKITALLFNSFTILLIFDGILRKWIFPNLSYLIMIIKLAVGMLLLILCHDKLRGISWWAKALAVLGGITFLTTLLFGHGNLIVAIYGCIPYFVVIPFCFMLGHLLTREAIICLTRLLFLAMLLNAIVLLVQYNLPITHWINYGGPSVTRLEKAGLEHVSTFDSSGMRNNVGFFMDTQGELLLVLMLPLAYLGLVRGRKAYRLACLVSVCCAIMTGFLSVSRTIVFVSIVLILYSVFILRFQKTIFINALLLLLITLSFFLENVVSVVDNANKRFEGAASSFSDKGVIDGNLKDIGNRTIWLNVEALYDPHASGGKDPVPFWGYGQGKATQVGGKLIHGQSGFLLSEFDGQRIVCESGIFLGWLIIFVRLGYCFQFLGMILHRFRGDDVIPALFLPAFIETFFLLTTWGKINSICQAMFYGGIFLAARRIYNQGAR